MGHADERDETEGILQELESFEEKYPGESRRLLEALRRLWAAPSIPEKVRIIRSSQPLLEELAERRVELARLTDLLERYERASRQLDKVREELARSDQEAEVAKRESLDAILKEATTRRSPTLQEILEACATGAGG